MNRSKKVSRQGISAEVFGLFNKKENFIPKTIPKEPHVISKIEELISNSILF